MEKQLQRVTIHKVCSAIFPHLDPHRLDDDLAVILPIASPSKDMKIDRRRQIDAELFITT